MFRTRFAPSPTGLLHEGHGLAASEAFGAAESADGECLLRIEDIDQTRCRPEFERAIFEDLSWLGFSWPEPVRRQSDHFDDYVSVLERLRALGVVYRSFLSRKDVAANLMARGIGLSPAGEYPYPGPLQSMSEDEETARVAAGDAFTWRLSLDRCRDYLGTDYEALSFVETGIGPDWEAGEVPARPDWLGDVILARKDTPTSYHVAVTHDDALQEISHIVRGQDLFHSTHVHVLLQRLMGWPTPVYRHHRLLIGKDGKKLSKSAGSRTLHNLKEAGVSASELRARWGSD